MHFQSINKRFQRLESHVVTLARSVAHLSSEMRTQHLMIQVRDKQQQLIQKTTHKQHLKNTTSIRENFKNGNLK